jgi:hypothetical protein
MPAAADSAEVQAATPGWQETCRHLPGEQGTCQASEARKKDSRYLMHREPKFLRTMQQRTDTPRESLSTQSLLQCPVLYGLHYRLASVEGSSPFGCADIAADCTETAL